MLGIAQRIIDTLGQVSDHLSVFYASPLAHKSPTRQLQPSHQHSSRTATVRCTNRVTRSFSHKSHHTATHSAKDLRSSHTSRGVRLHCNDTIEPALQYVSCHPHQSPIHDYVRILLSLHCSTFNVINISHTSNSWLIHN
jgi:hypothetical protein